MQATWPSVSSAKESQLIAAQWDAKPKTKTRTCARSRSAAIRSAGTGDGQVHFRSAARLDLALVGQNNWLVYLAQLWQEMCTHIRSISCSFTFFQLHLQRLHPLILASCRAASSKLSNLTTQFAINNRVPTAHSTASDQVLNWSTGQPIKWPNSAATEPGQRGCRRCLLPHTVGDGHR